MEWTGTPHAVMAAVLARNDLVEKRRALMESWSQYLAV